MNYHNQKTIDAAVLQLLEEGHNHLIAQCPDAPRATLVNLGPIEGNGPPVRFYLTHGVSTPSTRAVVSNVSNNTVKAEFTPGSLPGWNVGEERSALAQCIEARIENINDYARGHADSYRCSLDVLKTPFNLPIGNPSQNPSPSMAKGLFYSLVATCSGAIK